MSWQVPTHLLDDLYFHGTSCFSTVLLLTVVGLFTPYTSSAQVTIEGKVILERAQQPTVSTNLGGYQNAPSGSSFNEEEVSSKHIVLWLKAQDENISGTKNIDKGMPVLDQVDKHFTPRLMMIREGNIVRIRNSDPVYHNVFSLSKTKRFDVGRRSPGDYKDVQFDESGKVDVFCDIHSDMHAVIIVVPSRTVAMKEMESDGAFRFTNIPKGNYSLHLYALGDRTHSVEIQATDKEKITLQTIRLGS